MSLKFVTSTDLGATDEVQNLRKSLRQARQDHQALETQVRELRSTETSTKVGPFVSPSRSRQLTSLSSSSKHSLSNLPLPSLNPSA